MLIIILRNEIMIFIGSASPAGLSYCFFSIDALGSSRIQFEPIEQRPLLANSNRYNRLKKSRSNHQEWSIRISTFLIRPIQKKKPRENCKYLKVDVKNIF